MKVLDPLNFTVRLGEYYEQSRTSGTVLVSTKRMTPSRIKKACKVPAMASAASQFSIATEEVTQYPCLIRASFKKHSISTLVSPSEFEKFNANYSTIIRAYMDSLKKRERSKKKKGT